MRGCRDSRSSGRAESVQGCSGGGAAGCALFGGLYVAQKRNGVGAVSSEKANPAQALREREWARWCCALVAKHATVHRCCDVGAAAAIAAVALDVSVDLRSKRK